MDDDELIAAMAGGDEPGRGARVSRALAAGQNAVMATYSVNQDAVAWAHQLIDRRQYVRAIGLDRAQPVAAQSRCSEQPPQPRERVFHDSVTRTFERVVRLEDP